MKRIVLNAVSIALGPHLQLIPWTKGHQTAGRDRNRLARLRTSTGTLRLVSQLETTESGQADLLPAFECSTHFLKEGLDQFPGLAFVESQLLAQPLSQISLA